MRSLLALVALAAAAPATLADFAGRVVKVRDGDTLTVFVNQRQISFASMASTLPSLGARHTLI
jgi:endonuclease YncB( thermonuclease family)